MTDDEHGNRCIIKHYSLGNFQGKLLNWRHYRQGKTQIVEVRNLAFLLSLGIPKIMFSYLSLVTD